MVPRRILALRWVVVAMLVSLNQGQFYNRKYKGPKVDPALQKRFTNILNVKQTASKNSGLSLQLIQRLITVKFKSEIVQLFIFLPHSYRCNIVESVSNATNCNSTFISNTLLDNYIILNSKKIDCVSNRTLYCSGSNISEIVLGAFWNQMVSLFNELPVPFQCTIVNKVSTSLTSSVKKHRHKRSSFLIDGKTLKISFQMVESQLQKVYPTLNITQRCSKVWKPLKKKVPLESPAALVNVTVQLNQGARRKAWIKRLRRKAYRIYRIYSNYKFNMKKSNLLSDAFDIYSSKTQLVPKKDVRLIVIRFTKLSHLVVNVVFSLEVKKPGSTHYSKVKPAKQIIKAINETGRYIMGRIFQGNVLMLTGAKKDRPDTNSLWTSEEMGRARRQFPTYLISYFRLGIDRVGRCLVMVYISTNLQKDLREVELFYNAKMELPKKYFCSSTRRKTVTDVSMRTFYRANETELHTKPSPRSKGGKKDEKEKNLLLDKINEGEKFNFTMVSSEPITEPPDFFEEEEKIVEESETPRKISALEIGLLCLLALLCVAIVAFAVNCVIFAFKRKSAQSADQPPAKTGFALFRKVEETRSNTQTGDGQCVNGALPKVENSQNDTKLGNTTICLSSPHKQPNTIEEARELDSQQIDLQQNIYSQDPLCLITNCPRRSRNEIENEDSQKTCENSESGDDVFCEQIFPEVNNSESESTAVSLNNDCSSKQDTRQRTLKESCGEMRLVSENDSVSRSLSSSKDLDPFIKNNIMQVVVVFDDQSSERESST